MRASMLDAVPVTSLTGVGGKMAEKLEKIGLFTVQDLLFHLPYRYEDRTRIWPMMSLMPGQHAAVEGEVVSNNTTFGRRRMLTVKITDGHGSLTLRFFNFNAAMKNSLESGKRVKAYGEIKRGQNGLEIIHPEYKVFSEPTELALEETLTPVYHTTEGLRQLTLRNLTDQALGLLDGAAVQELLPDGLYDRQVTLKDALKTLHRPTPDIAVTALENGEHPAQKRLILEELLAQNLSMLAVRSKLQQDPTFSMPPSSELKPKFLTSLPF
ncbi:OB-fold nucleic acid binding domain-containing protein, partial [Enterovibrio norvegicus]